MIGHRVCSIRRRRSAAIFGLVILGACASSGPSAPLPPPPAVVSVAMDEYSYSHRRDVEAGRVVFRLGNDGALRHELLLVRLPDDLGTTLDEQLRSPTRRPVTTLASVAVGPAERGVLAADLVPGRYGFLCFIDDGDGTNHALKGMSSELVVGGRRDPVAARGSS